LAKPVAAFEPIRVLVVEDETMVRRSFCTVLGQEDDIEVVGEAGDGHQAVAQAKTLAPHVVLMDVGLPRLNGIEACRRVCALRQAPRVLALSAHADLSRVVEMLRAGACGYIYKAGEPSELIEGVRVAVAGGRFISPSLEGSLPAGLDEMVSSRSKRKIGRLSGREREVLQLVTEGHSSPEIATSLGISPKTVEVHRRNIGKKLGIKTVAGLTKWAIREGLTSTKV